jgi:sulfite exporter TauE/SafE
LELTDAMNGFLGIVMAAAFTGGLAGGVHCAGMCGGIVHALCAAQGRQAGKRQMRYLLAYNAGRVASYACAGMLAGAIGQAGLLTRAAPVLQPLLFALASIMLVALGLYLAGAMPMITRIESAGAWLWRGIQPWSRHVLPVTTLPRALGLGALWGWLPCGMVYAVLLSALALGSWWQGALVMLAFGLGTLPNLLGIGVLWRQLDRLHRPRTGRVFAGCVVVVFGIYGLVKAIQPSIISNDGLLCYLIPGLSSWLP